MFINNIFTNIVSQKQLEIEIHCQNLWTMENPEGDYGAVEDKEE